MLINKFVATAHSIAEFTWSAPAELIDACAKIGFVLAIIWVIFILFQFALPSRQGGGQKLKRIGVLGFLGAAALILLLFNIEQLPVIVNAVIALINWVAELLGNIN